jgi:hypothetical protein
VRLATNRPTSSPTATTIATAKTSKGIAVGYPVIGCPTPTDGVGPAIAGSSPP